MQQWPRKACRGFTLIEIAIVLVVVGLLISGGLTAVRPILAASQEQQTVAALDRIEQALVIYAIRYNCLPCPAANAGTGVSGWGTVVSNCESTTCATVRGVVPWQTLGLQRSDGLDAWSSRIGYAVTPALTLAASMDRNGSDYSPLGTLEVNTIAGADVTTAGDPAAFVLVSFGANRGFAFGDAGVQTAGDAAHLAEAENSDADDTYVQDNRSDINDANAFDDIVRWKSKPILVGLCGDGACGNG